MNKNKRLLALCLSVIFLIFTLAPGYNAVYAADKSQLSVTLGKNPVENGITVKAGDADTKRVVVKGGKECWQSNIAENFLYIYCNVDDNIIYDCDGSYDIEVSVEYFDEGNGSFSIFYDNGTLEDNEDEIVKITNTKAWKIKTFHLENAKFTNKISSSDFRIALWTKAMGSISADDICFSNISVKKVPPKNPIIVTHEPSRLGNIFTEGESVDIGLRIENKTDKVYKLNVSYVVLDDMDNTCYSGEDLVQLKNHGSSAATVDKVFHLPIDRFGVFLLKTKISDPSGEIKIEKEITFSHLRPYTEDSLNKRVLVNTHNEQLNKATLDNLAPIVKLLGAVGVRDGFSWGGVEKTPGVYTVDPKHQIMMDASEDYGINLTSIAVMAYGNQFYDGGTNPYTDEGIAAYANYCKAVAARNKGKWKYYEIWNEWDGEGHRTFNPKSEPPEVYAKLLIAAYSAIKSADPDAVVIGMSTASINVDWIERVIKAGAGNSFDILSVHTYCKDRAFDLMSPEKWNLVGKTKKLKDMLEKYGIDKPVWSTEVGWDSGRFTKRGQAELTTRMLILNHAFDLYETVSYYDLQNDGNNKQDYEHTLGLIDYIKGPVVPYAAKPAFSAVKVYNEKLAQAEFISDYSPDDDLRIYRFKRDTDNKDILTVWKTDGFNNVTINLGCDEVTVSDINGNPSIIKGYNGDFTVLASEAPIYIEGVFEDVKIQEPKFKLSTLNIDACGGDTFSISLSKTAGNEALEGVIEVKTPNGWFAEGDFAFSSSEQNKKINITVPKNVDVKSYQIGLNPVSNGISTGELTLIVNITDPITVTGRLVPKEYGNWDEWQLKVGIKNNTVSLPLSGKVSILQFADWQQNLSPVTFDEIPPGEKREVSFDIAGDYSILVGATIGINIALDNNKQIEKAIKLDTAFASYTEKPPQIDGKINSDEWMDAIPFRLDNRSLNHINGWEGAEDCSAGGYLKWDDSNLYLAVTVKDNVHSQNNTVARIWNGDSLQIGFDQNRFIDDGGGNNQFGVALSDNGEILQYRFVGSRAKTAGETSNIVCSITRSGIETHYELAIPWSDVIDSEQKPQPGSFFGYSLLVNDNDGSGRKGYIEYGGIGAGNSPAGYINLLLADSTQAFSNDDRPFIQKEIMPEIKVFIDGQLQIYDQPAVMTGQTAIVSLRGISESLGARVIWNGETQTVTIVKGIKRIVLTLNSSIALLGTEEKILATPVRLVNGAAMAPLRFICEAMGARVTWNEATQAIDVFTAY